MRNKRIVLFSVLLVGTLVVACAGTPPPTPVIQSTPIPPPQPTIQPPTQAVPATAVAPSGQPQITVNPSSGSVRTRVTLTGSGFPPNALVSVTIGPPDAGGTSAAYAMATSGPDGRVSIVFPIPSEWPDGKSITDPKLIIAAATQDIRVKATTEFTLSAP